MLICAGRVVADSGDLVPGHVLVEKDRIAAVGAGIPPSAQHHYPSGTLVPGFIDLQVNGGTGVDLLNCAVQDIERLCGYLASTGTTGFLPTLVSAPLDQIQQALTRLRQARPHAAEILGAHVEGPAINPERAGAHDPRFLRPAGDPQLRKFLAAVVPQLRVVTLAPELPGAGDLIAWLVDRGVVVSLGHTDATYAQAVDAFRRGARMVTHLFNAMRGLHHREPGVVGAALDHPDCVCGLIADGVHVHPAAVRLAFSVLGSNRVALVSDAIAAAGMPSGEYRLGGRIVRMEEGDAPRLPGGSLAGSALRQDEAVRRVVAWGIPLRDAIHSAAAVPAGLLGLADRGVIAEGMRADLCVLGEDGRAVLTVVAGQTVYARSGW